MRIIYAILCILFVSSSISYGYEQVPDDAKVKKEDVSKEVMDNFQTGNWMTTGNKWMNLPSVNEVYERLKGEKK